MSTEASAYRPAIQGLRAVAVLMVVAYHAGLPVEGGFTGVDVFFVISGFVITEMLRREHLQTGTISLRRFIRRRVRRLLPALSVVIVATVLLSALTVAPFEHPTRTAVTGLAGVLMSANVAIAVTTGDYFDAPAETNPLLHLWSLSVEEQFYLILPSLLLLAWRVRPSRHRVTDPGLKFVVILGTSSFFLMAFGDSVVAATGLPRALFGFYSPVVRAWEFMVGVALGLTGRWRTLGPLARRVSGGTGIGLLLASLTVSGASDFPGLVAVLPVLGSALIIIALEARSGPVHRFLATRSMVALGDLSYSWYLWHWPLIVLSTILAGGSGRAGWAPLLAALVSLIPTALTYRLIEQPIRHREVTLRPLLFRYFAMPMVVLGFAFTGAQNSWWIPPLRDASAQLETRSIARQAGCHSFLDSLGPERFDECWFGPTRTASISPVYLLGDSNAATASDPVIAAGTVLNRPVFVSSGSDCPPFVGEPRSGGDPCERLVSATLEWLRTQPAGDVVLVMTDYPWYRDGTPVADSSAFAAALLATVEVVRSAGHRPVVVTPIPAFIGLDRGVADEIWRLSSCSTLAFLSGDCGESFVLTSDWPQQPLWDATRAVAVGTGSVLVDLVPHVCPDRTCRTDRNGNWDYRDGTHLSARRAQELAPIFVDSLRDSLRREW